MTPGARWFFGRKGRVPHADTKGGAVLWPKGQGPPHLTLRASSRGLCERSRLCSAPHSTASGSLVPPDPPNMGHLTNGWSALTALYSLLHDVRAGGDMPWLTIKNGDALCVKEVGVEQG